MNKKHLLFIALIAFVGFSNAQKSDLEGVWKLTESFEYDGEIRTTSMNITFKDPDVIEISGRNLGTWIKNETENTLTINCEHFENIDGENKIETLDDKELKLLNANGEISTLQRISLPKGKELNNKFTGVWLLEKVEKDGEIDFVGQIMDLNSNGIFYAQGIVFGKWDYNKATKRIIFDVTEENEKLNGEHPIIKSNKVIFIINVEGTKLYFIKINHEKIAKENSASDLIGTWIFNGVPNSYTKSVVTFKEPDGFKIVEVQEGMESTLNGMWMFNKKEMTLMMIGLHSEDTFKGINKVIKVNEETLELANSTNVYLATKKVENPEIIGNSLKAESTLEIEHLSFTYDDFTTDDGNYKYNREVEKLPWQDFYLLIDQISDIKQLVYSYDKLIEETHTSETKILKADVFIEEDNQRFRVDNIFYGYDRYNTPEDSFFPENDENGNADLYPLNESMYRVVGQEKLTLSIGIFNCTVVEALNGIEKLKIWIMNDKPAIIAKLIKESKESNDQYSIYELQEIIYN